MKIPFTKAHGAHNDFLLTWRDTVPNPTPALARAICERHTGVGADGWMLVERGGADCDGSIRLFNSDGSEAEISGNGTRCAAALLVAHGCASPGLRIRTGAGLKHLRLVERAGLHFTFEMDMGQPEIRDLHFSLLLSAGPRDVTLVWVGNPQCAVLVEDFNFDWRALGAEIESHPHFPHRTNVSFIRPVDSHTIDVRFYERGAGETMSSGTGSTGAAAAALARGLVQSPVRVLTPAGPLDLRLAPLATGRPQSPGAPTNPPDPRHEGAPLAPGPGQTSAHVPAPAAPLDLRHEVAPLSTGRPQSPAVPTNPPDLRAEGVILLTGPADLIAVGEFMVGE